MSYEDDEPTLQEMLRPAVKALRAISTLDEQARIVQSHQQREANRIAAEVARVWAPRPQPQRRMGISWQFFSGQDDWRRRVVNQRYSKS